MSLEIVRKNVDAFYCKGEGTDPFEIIINDEVGSIMVRYCYGSFAAIWSGQAGKLLQFLNDVDDSYILKNMIREQKAFDADGTVEKLIATAKKAMEDLKIDEEDLENIEYFLEDDLVRDSYESFLSSMLDCPSILDVWGTDRNDLGDYWVNGFEEAVWSYRPETQFFIHKIFPYVRRFINESNTGNQAGATSPKFSETN